MPRTSAQAEASRINGAKSRGPATPAGKAASAQNALRHGLCAADVRSVPFEDYPAFRDLFDGLTAAHQPSDVQEEELVRGLFLACWQVRRGHELERQYWKGPGLGLACDELRHLRQLHAEGPACRLETIMRYQGRAELARARALRDLAAYRALRDRQAERQASAQPVGASQAEAAVAPPRSTNEPGTLAEPAGMNEPENRVARPRSMNEPEAAARPRRLAAMRAPAQDDVAAAYLAAQGRDGTDWEAMAKALEGRMQAGG